MRYKTGFDTKLGKNNVVTITYDGEFVASVNLQLVDALIAALKPLVTRKGRK